MWTQALHLTSGSRRAALEGPILACLSSSAFPRSTSPLKASGKAAGATEQEGLKGKARGLGKDADSNAGAACTRAGFWRGQTGHARDLLCAQGGHGALAVQSLSQIHWQDPAQNKGEKPRPTPLQIPLLQRP